MSDKTPRDKVWLSVIDALVNYESIKKTEIVESTGVARGTAEDVLHAAEEYGILHRDSLQAQTYYSDVDPIGRVEDSEYKRAIQTLIEEARTD